MSEPIITFLYNTSAVDSPYLGTGEETEYWKKINTITGSGTADLKVFTGGGINGAVSTPTAPYGSRDATIRPISGRIPIPQTFIESTNNNLMYNVPLAGQTTNRYVFCAYVEGYLSSDLYLECWDDSSLLTTSLAVLSGTATYSGSMINAIRTTTASPSPGWVGTTLSGSMTVTSGGVCLRGYDSRLRLKGADSVTNEALYYNMFVYLPYDAPLFHQQPVEAFRYTYI